MNIIIPLVVCVINLLLGIFVLTQDRRSQISWSFFSMTLLICVWVVASFITNQHYDDVTINNVTNRIAFIAGYGVVVSGLWFTCSFPVVKNLSKKLIVFLWLSSVVVVALSMTSLVAGDVTQVAGVLTYSNAPLVGVYVVAYVGVIVLITNNLLRLPKGISKRQQVQSKIVLLAFTATALIGLVCNVLIPLATDDWKSTEYGPIATLFLVSVISYAMIRHGLFDIRFAVVRTITYTLSLITLAALYLVVAFFLMGQLADQQLTHGQQIANVILVLVLAFLFQPIKNFFDKITNKLFYKDNYSMSEFITRLNRTLNSTNDLRSLLERTTLVVASILKADQVFSLVQLGDGHYITAGTENHSKVSIKEFDVFSEILKGKTEVIMASELDSSSPVCRMMTSYKLQLVMPLYKNSTLVGFLCLGEHKTLGYTLRDIRSLLTISDELTIAIQNALSVEEVKKLNDTLEQRISSATKELRASNSQLQRLDEAKDEFISMASHQLRTPLTSIKGYVSMLIEGDVGKVSEEQKHLLNEVFISSERMVRLIGDFLNVSRLQTGKFVIEKHPINLALLVQREIDGLEQNASVRSIKFIYKMSKNIPVLELDENKIQQVVMNFSDNAMYYSKENSKVTVSLEKIDGYVEFKVIDSGIGVPESEQPHLFNKFFRATNARKARPDGTGVGLFLAKKVITEHGGQIIFESKEGKGSTFGFRLPLPKN